MYKLPYIRDKNLYAAVVGACSYVKKTGWFHKACNYYADKYNVDVADVEKYVRIAQGNGQKIANKKNPRKYHWYAVEYSVMNGYYPYFKKSWAVYEVKKATSEENVKRAIDKREFSWGTGSEWSFRCAYFGRVEKFDTEEAARECIEEWKTEDKEE